jgi:hypothetical protein
VKRPTANLPSSRQGRGLAVAMADATSADQHRREIGEAHLSTAVKQVAIPVTSTRRQSPVHQRVSSVHQSANSTTAWILSRWCRALLRQIVGSRGQEGGARKWQSQEDCLNLIGVQKVVAPQLPREDGARPPTELGQDVGWRCWQNRPTWQWDNRSARDKRRRGEAGQRGRHVGTGEMKEWLAR